MMRDAEKTIGNLIDKQGVSFIASISEDGFPNMKAMLPPRKRVGIREFSLRQTPPPCGWRSIGKIPTPAFTSAISASSGGLC